MENLCLENYGIQELNAQELNQIEGGNPYRVLYTIAKTI